MNESASSRIIPLACQEHGAGEPMVLVHGWGVSGAAFDAQVEALSAHYRLIIPDLPSHGVSPAFPANGSFSLLADSLAALIGRLGLERPLLVGWSLGGMVCWDLVLRYSNADHGGPARTQIRGLPSTPIRGLPRTQFRGLVSVDAMPRVLAGDDWRYGLGESWMSEFNISLEAMRADWPAFCASFVPGIFAEANEGRLAETIERMRGVAEGNDAEGAIRIWQQILAQDFRETLADLQLPAMVIHGARSRLWEDGAAGWMAEHVPHWQFQVFEHSGHSPQIEEPGRFNRAILEFAAEIRGNPDRTHRAPATTGAALK